MYQHCHSACFAWANRPALRVWLHLTMILTGQERLSGSLCLFFVLECVNDEIGCKCGAINGYVVLEWVCVAFVAAAL
jgi:hypothetical protein